MPSSPVSGRFSGGALSNSGRPTAPIRTASASSASFSVSAGNGVAGLVDRDAAEQAFAQGAAVCFHFSATTRSTRTASRVTSVPMPSPGRTRMLRFKYSPVPCNRRWRRLARQPADCRCGERGDLLVHQALLVVGQRGESRVDDVELFLRESRSPDLRSASSARGGRCACPSTSLPSGTPTDFGSMISYVVFPSGSHPDGCRPRARRRCGPRWLCSAAVRS